MANTVLQIAGRRYPLRCRDGEEEHLAMLAGMIEEKAGAAQDNVAGLTETRTLLFAALFLADELYELRSKTQLRQERLALEDDEPAARAIEALATRIEKLHDRLAADSDHA